jgi:carbamoyltransferase
MRIVGISPFHDSSVAVINNGLVESFFKEERLSGEKRDDMPFKSMIAAAMSLKGKVDYVTLASPTENDQSLYAIKAAAKKIFECPVVVYCGNHHLAHASLAFYNSGFSKSLVFVIDRNGSLVANDRMREAETVFDVSYPCEFKTLHKNYWMLDGNINHLDIIESLNKTSDFTFNVDSTYSIVKVYESATTLINQQPLENGKTMGLAAYGEDTVQQKFFNNGRPDDNLFIQGNFVGNLTTKTVLNKNHIGKITKTVDKNNYQMYADYAFAVQKQTQERVLEFVKEWVNKTGITNVCLTGGYALNVVANEYLIKKLPNVNFYFEPLADDSGNSIGSALHLYRDKTKDETINKIKTTFIHGIEQNIVSIGKSVTVDEVADLLIKQKTVAVFNGKAESGPRALGNRSILFDARNVNAKEIVNLVKQREWYRPFAAMILQSNFEEYFETHGIKFSEFMTMSFQCKKPELIPGVVHVDNSTRVQTIDNSIKHIYDLLMCFNSKTECPVLLNTSFNLAGQPLIETQEQAIETFINSKIDALWFPETHTILLKEIS